jgi:predicted acylesterase/phospholipase RssA
VSSGAVTQRWVNERVAATALEDLRLPLVVAATRVRDGSQALFNHGDTGLAVRASSASPRQFQPVRIGDEMYVDGDESSPVPIRAARLARREGGDRRGRLGVPRAPRRQTLRGEWVEMDARRASQVAAEAPRPTCCCIRTSATTRATTTSTDGAS